MFGGRTPVLICFLAFAAIGLAVLISGCQDKNQAFLAAAKDGNLADVRDLLEKGAEIGARGPDGRTALALASQKGHLNVVKLLLDKGAEADDGASLWLASAKGHLAVVALLLSKGADPNQADLTTEETALMAAAHGGYASVVKLLLQNGADAWPKTEKGWTALSRAKEKGNKEVMDLLKMYGARE